MGNERLGGGCLDNNPASARPSCEALSPWPLRMRPFLATHSSFRSR